MSDPSLWDKEAESFDQAVDHGLLQETARRAWEELLLPLVETWGRQITDERYIVTAHRARPDQGLSGNSVVARSS